MQLGTVVCAAAFLGFSASTALAVEETFKLENVEGRIAVQMPVGFMSAVSGMTVHAGQKIMVRPGSSAMISYAEGACFINLRKPGVFVVPAKGKCAPGQVTVFDGSFNVIPANGGPAPLLFQASTEPQLVAGAFVTAVFGSALWVTITENRTPVTVP